MDSNDLSYRYKEKVRRLPRWVKICGALALVLIFVTLVMVVLLVLLLLIRLLGGGSLPNFLQGLLDWVQQNLQPFLNIWQDVQNLTGGSGK